MAMAVAIGMAVHFRCFRRWHDRRVRLDARCRAIAAATSLNMDLGLRPRRELLFHALEPRHFGNTIRPELLDPVFFLAVV